VAARRQVEEIQLFHVQESHAWNIAEGLADSIVFTVDDARAGFHDAASVSHFALAGALALGFVDLLHVGPRVELTQDADGFLGFGDGFHAVVDDEGNLGDSLDLVTFGHDQCGDTRGGDGGSHGEALLVGVDAMMPAAPRLRRREHAAAATHVAESTLAGTVGAAAAHARNTSDGATSAP